MYKQARKSAGLSIEEAAFQLHIAPRTLAKYESQKTASACTTLDMSKVYKDPTLNVQYCRNNCPVGKVYNYEYLNNIILSPQNIILNLYQKHRVAGNSLDNLKELVVNKDSTEDFTEEEKSYLKQEIYCLLNLEHAIQVIKLELDKRNWVDMPALIHAHNSKCLRKGYVEHVKEARVGYSSGIKLRRTKKSRLMSGKGNYYM